MIQEACLASPLADMSVILLVITFKAPEDDVLGFSSVGVCYTKTTQLFSRHPEDHGSTNMFS